MNDPAITEFPRFFAAGCPQFGDPAQICPGLAWDRLGERKRNAPIHTPYDFEIGLKVYPQQRPDTGGQFYCMAAIPLKAPPTIIPMGYFVAEIPENRYAVFDIPSFDDLAPSFDDIYHAWLPRSKFVACHGYDFESFTQTPEFKIQIWVPITDKVDTTSTMAKP